MTTDLVVCCYCDNLDWVKALQPTRLFIYDKWDGVNAWQSRWSNHLGPRTVVVPLPNVGKCDHAYLHHIVTYYKELADWTVFSVDAPYERAAIPDGVSMEDALTPGDSLRVPRLWRGRDWGPDGSLNWKHWGNLMSRSGQSWKERYESGQIEHARLSFVEWVRRYVGFDPDGVAWPGYAPGGIYAVPRHAITYLPVAFYERLREQVSHSVEPEEAHYMERVWPVIFSGLARYKPEG